MRKYTYSLSDIREVITDIPELFEQEPTMVTVMQDGKPVMTILPISIYELVERLDSILETREIMKDEELMAAIRQGIKEMEEGKVEPWEDVKKELGWEGDDPISLPSTYSISEICEVITQLPEHFDEEKLERVTVTRHGKPIMTVLPITPYKELLEMIDAFPEGIEALQDEELVTDFRQGIKEGAE